MEISMDDQERNSDAPSCLSGLQTQGLRFAVKLERAFTYSLVTPAPGILSGALNRQTSLECGWGRGCLDNSGVQIMCETMPYDDFQLLGQLGQIARQPVAHLDRRLQAQRPLLQHVGEILS